MMVGYIVYTSMYLPGNSAISKIFFVKQALTAISSVVTTDYVTKMTMSVVSDYAGDHLNILWDYTSDYINEVVQGHTVVVAKTENIHLEL